MNPLVRKATALLPSLPQRFNTGAELVHYVKGCEAIRLAVNEAIDYRIGEALAQAKLQLDHGQFLPACEELGYQQKDAHRLRSWYERRSCHTVSCSLLMRRWDLLSVTRGA